VEGRGGKEGGEGRGGGRRKGWRGGEGRGGEGMGEDGRKEDRGKEGKGCRRREVMEGSKQEREWEGMAEEGKGEGRKGWREVSINIMIYYRLATDAVTVEGILTSLEVRYFRTRVSLFTIRSSWL